MAESSPNVSRTLWEKGEIARNEQFLLFPQCFQKTFTADRLKPVLVWERVKTHLLCCLQRIPIMGKVTVTGI